MPVGPEVKPVTYESNPLLEELSVQGPVLKRCPGTEPRVEAFHCQTVQGNVPERHLSKLLFFHFLELSDEMQGLCGAED